MRFTREGVFLDTKEIKSNGKVFHISKVLIKEDSEIAEVFSPQVVPYINGDIVTINVNANMATKKVSCNFAS